jgi:three-Cys-motif partner protein
MVILSQGKFPEILYIDGFAGPGMYAGGEDGSPIIALKTALGYKPPLAAKVHFLFVEKDQARADHLGEIVGRMQLPSNMDFKVECMTFEEAWRKHYPRYLRGNRLIPTFAFIDPFGWTGIPFAIVRQVMQHPSCEVFVNFMYEEVNRFLSHPDQVENFDAFFGTNKWRDCDRLSEPSLRSRCLHDLYMQQLGDSAGIPFVRSFKMSNKKDVTDYFLFYGTRNLTGLKKMKEAMWKVDESGEFRFSDATDQNQMVLFEKAPDLKLLRAQIVQRFAGVRATIPDIEKFVVADTAFRESHYKGVLKELEAIGQLDVISAKPGRKRGTFGDQSMVICLRAMPKGGVSSV